MIQKYSYSTIKRYILEKANKGDKQAVKKFYDFSGKEWVSWRDLQQTKIFIFDFKTVCAKGS